MDTFPVFFRMDNATVAVFGGGALAMRKVRLLAKTPARVLVFTDRIDPDFGGEFRDRAEWCSWCSIEARLGDCRFAIIAEPDETLAREAFERARAASVPVNWVDRKAWCDFTVPSILDRGRLVAAFATGGAAPVLARGLRGEMETLMPPELAALTELSAALRPAVKIRFPTETERRRFWERFFDGPVASAMLAGDRPGAMAALDEAFQTTPTGSAFHPVSVLIPPADGADRISLRAFRTLQTAEFAALEPGTDPDLLDLLRRDADRAALDADALDAALRTGARCVAIASRPARDALIARLDTAGIAWTPID